MKKLDNIILLDLEATNYSETGRKYGVSDNAIRKWVKFYEKNLFK